MEGAQNQKTGENIKEDVAEMNDPAAGNAATKKTDSKYIPSPDLETARKVAEFLNRPLLLAGEPGTGKTTYANHIKDTANKDLFVFNTKSVSQAQDLFYTYDAVAHFANKDKTALEFVSLGALGKSIINALGPETVRQMLLNATNGNYQLLLLQESPNREAIINRFLYDCCGKDSVVLIDEVDKAPRDFPNDILNEIENYEFELRELGLLFSLVKAGKTAKDKIFVILTSNFDKNLPDAFLRRCIFFEIEFPDEIHLMEIIRKHIAIPAEKDILIKDRLKDFFRIRKTEGISKPPATSEFIDCLKWLTSFDQLGNNIEQNKAALATLIKKKQDFQLIFKAKSGI